MIISAAFDAHPDEIVSVEPDARRPEWCVIGVELSCGRVHKMKARREDLASAGVMVPS